MHIPRILATALTALIASACAEPAEFSTPISAPGAATHDERLIGTWYAANVEGDDSSVALLAIKAAEAGGLETAFGFMSVAPGAMGHAGALWMHRTAHASVIDGTTYYNSLMIDGGMVSKEVAGDLEINPEAMFVQRSDRGYWIFRAEFNEAGTLMLYGISDEIPKKLGLPSHTVDCGEDCDITVFDLPSEALAQLIRTEDREKLFEFRMGPFVRIGQAYPLAAE